MIHNLKKLFERDLNKLEREMSSYKNPLSIWETRGEISNSGGNLCLHIVGNLQHFIGFIIGKTDYERDREQEFEAKEVPFDDLLAEIISTKVVVGSLLSQLTSEDLELVYPVKVFGSEVTVAYFLIHLYGHLNYHLGQINYHRRLLDQ